MAQQAFPMDTVCVMCHSLAVSGQEHKMEKREQGIILSSAQMCKDRSHCILHARISCALSRINATFESRIFNTLTVKTEQGLYCLEYD